MYAIAVILLAAAGVLAAETLRYAIATWPATEEAAPAPPLEAPPAPEPEPVAEPPPERAPLVERDPYDPTPDAPTGLTTLALGDGETFCKSLENAGLSDPVYQRGAWPSETWTCVPDIYLVSAGAEAQVSSLFVSMRGLAPDRLLSLRIKLNLLDPATTPIVRAKAKELLTRMLAVFSGSPPQAILDAVDSGADLTLQERGVTYEYKKEFGDARRSNLLVVFPQQLGQGGEARFIDARGR